MNRHSLNFNNFYISEEKIHATHTWVCGLKQENILNDSCQLLESCEYICLDYHADTVVNFCSVRYNPVVRFCDDQRQSRPSLLITILATCYSRFLVSSKQHAKWISGADLLRPLCCRTDIEAEDQTCYPVTQH